MQLDIVVINCMLQMRKIIRIVRANVGPMLIMKIFIRAGLHMLEVMIKEVKRKRVVPNHEMKITSDRQRYKQR